MKPFYIVTTRFTNATWEENERWKKNHGWKGCVYGVPSLISEFSKIPPRAVVYVVEMNNDTNKIMGIGAICNRYRIDLRERIYNDYFYNRYIYRDRAHITRDKLYNLSPAYKKFVDYLVPTKKINFILKNSHFIAII